MSTSNFSFSEFTASGIATRLGVDNSVPDDLLPEAYATLEMMERVRTLLSRVARRDVPITVTSGYRCLALNRAIGSGNGSDHLKAAAVDFRAPVFGTPTAICQALKPYLRELGIGQLINEYPDRNGWVHVSRRAPRLETNAVITITAAGTFPGVRA